MKPTTSDVIQAAREYQSQRRKCEQCKTADCEACGGIREANKAADKLLFAAYKMEVAHG